MPSQYAFIFGRTPELSLLELNAVAGRFGIRVIKMIEVEIALVERDTALTSDQLQGVQATLGGTVRIAELFFQVEREAVVQSAAQLVLDNAAPEGKITVGVSTWSAKGKPAPATKIAKPLKEILTHAGRSIRIVTPPAPRSHLSAPQLIHNKLVGGNAAANGRAIDLVCISGEGGWWLGITKTVQDIEGYTFRDFGIPKPDPVSGMLPPKLAQTLVNLGVGSNAKLSVYDPFCGNGRIVLEATLLGIPAFGSDLRPEQVAATRENLAWLCDEYGLDPVSPENVWAADATKGPGQQVGEPFVIVAEPYLGKPLRAKLQPSERAGWIEELTSLYLEFFQYWAESTEKPESFTVIFPRALCTDDKDASVYDAIIDRLHLVGYSTRVLFCYDRPDSLVRRDIVSLKLVR